MLRSVSLMRGIPECVISRTGRWSSICIWTLRADIVQLYRLAALCASISRRILRIIFCTMCHRRLIGVLKTTMGAVSERGEVGVCECIGP